MLRLTLGLAASIAAALAYEAYRWQSETNAMHARHEAGRLPIRPTVYQASELSGLPALVQRYRCELSTGHGCTLAPR